MFVFFQLSLRDKAEHTQKGFQSGMNVMVLDINQGAWKLETEREL